MDDTLVFRPPGWVVRLFQGLALLGGATLVAGSASSPGRAWPNVLLVSNYLVGLAAGGLVLVALHYVTGARWSVPLRRLPEALAVALPAAGLGIPAVLLLQPSVYPWTLAPAGEHASAFRGFWLERPFVLGRALAYLAVWLAFALLIVRASRRQDRTGDPALTRRNVRLSAGFLVAFGVTCWLSSDDWLMSLEPDWASTMFSVYNFTGIFLSALACVTLLAVCLRRRGALRALVTPDRLHDLGTLLFAFSCFWAYTWFCQYLLIWYTNHPEETRYLVWRWQGDWPALVFLDLALSWGVPFVVLLFRSAKRNPLILGAVALVVLAGRWVDLYLMIFPSQGEALATPGVAEAGFALGAVGLGGLAVFWALGRAPLVPLHDPLFPRERPHPEAQG
jgi:hypothetical protein